MRGLTLAELAVAIALLGVVATGVYRIVVSGQRSYRVQAERMDLHQALRVAAHLLPAELRELDASDGDILGMSSDSIRIRAMRQLSFLCAPAALGPLTRDLGVATATLTVARQPTFGLRDVDAATDSLLVYDDGADGWLAGKVIAIRDATCAAPDRRPARAVEVRLARPQGFGALPAGSPLRWYEPVTYLLYQARDGKHYVGQRNGGDLQPIVGPVTQRGFELSYYAAAGQATLDPRRVTAIEIRVRARSARLADSLVMLVGLRGTPP